MSKNLLNAAYRLSNITRFQGLRLSNPYNVAEHSFRATIIAMTLVDDYNERVTIHNTLCDRYDQKPLIDASIVMKKILLHDIGESFFGDIPSPAKNYTKSFAESFASADVKYFSNLVKDSICSEAYASLYTNEKKEETGEIVLLSDLLEAFIVASRDRSGEAIPAYYDLKTCLTEPTRIKKLLVKYPLANEYIINAIKDFEDIGLPHNKEKILDYLKRLKDESKQ